MKQYSIIDTYLYWKKDIIVKSVISLALFKIIYKHPSGLVWVVVYSCTFYISELCSQVPMDAYLSGCLLQLIRYNKNQ